MIIDSSRSPSPWRTAWQYTKHYWHWPVLLVAGVYLYQQYLPHIDLADEGRPAPNVVAETIDGNSFRLSDHRGEVVVVNVWATWCAPCRVEMPGFVDLQEEFRDEGVQFVGISVDQSGSGVVRSFVADNGVSFPQIVNPALAARHFPGEVVPRTYLIDKRGRIRYEHSGVILKWALDDALETLVAESADETTAWAPEETLPIRPFLVFLGITTCTAIPASLPTDTVSPPCSVAHWGFASCLCFSLSRLKPSPPRRRAQRPWSVPRPSRPPTRRSLRTQPS